MRKLTVTALVALASVVVAPQAAGASQGVGLPYAPIYSLTVTPPGFSSTAKQAEAAAERTSAMQALHRREHPMFVQPFVWYGRSPFWAVDFSYRGKLVAEVIVTRTAIVTHVWTGPLAGSPYTRGHYAPLFDSAWVLIPFSLLFLLPFLDPRRLRSMLHLDAVVLLSFLVSYELFDHAKLESAVWLAYPPLLYLLGRMLWLGMRGGRATGPLAPLLSTRALWIGLAVLVLGRTALSLANHLVIDVGYASVIGAHRIAHGQAVYYATAAHGDTYGPVAYLAYLPFERLFPWHGSWDYVASAHAATVTFDLVTIGALIGLGRRLAGGSTGTRLGLVLGWAWAACPFTLLGALMHTNDGLIAMLSVLSLLAFSRPAARGALLGLATAAKFSPAGLLPLYAQPRRGGWRSAAAVVASFTAVVVTAVAMYLPPGGLSEFYQHTIGYQLSRPDVFSPWALHPGLAWLKTTIGVGAVLLALLVAVVPRQRSLTQVCALAAAVTIAVQLPAVHWFYYYIAWFVPFVFVAVFSARCSPATVTNEARERHLVPAGEPRPAVAAA